MDRNMRERLTVGWAVHFELKEKVSDVNKVNNLLIM